MCVSCLPEPVAIAGRSDGPLRLTAEERAILHELPPLPAYGDHEGMAAWFDARNKALGLPTCRKCRGLLGVLDHALLHRGWCGVCEANWLERRILVPLRKRLGRRKALRALRRLAR